jgi:hypothetical protein
LRTFCLEMANVQVPPVVPLLPEDPEEAFNHVLEHVVGLDTAVKRERVTINGGVRTIDDILYVEIDSLLECLTQNTSVLARTRLKTLKFWAEAEDDIGNGINLNHFTAEVCRERQKIIAKSTRSTNDTGDKATATREKLSTFNGKRENWGRAKRELIAYLNQIKNDNGVPLYYVIRDPDLEDQYRNDNGEIGRKIYEAPFMGRIYSQDAFKVLQILRQWTSGGTADTFVDNNNDVQVAWSQLLRNYEGHDARNANIQKARETIAQAHWTRNTQNFTFDDYCNKHVKSNNELDRYNANVDGESQVNAFLKGIRADARLNPQILAIKALVLNGENSKNNLRSAIVTFKDTMRQLMGASNERDSRNIGSISRGGRFGRGHGRTHQGRGGRFGGRGGRGRFSNPGRGRGRTNTGRGHGEQRDQNNLYIPNEVLEAVGPKYQAMLFRGREQMEKESNTNEGNNNTNNTNANNNRNAYKNRR